MKIVGKILNLIFHIGLPPPPSLSTIKMETYMDWHKAWGFKIQLNADFITHGQLHIYIIMRSIDNQSLYLIHFHQLNPSIQCCYDLADQNFISFDIFLLIRYIFYSEVGYQKSIIMNLVKFINFNPIFPWCDDLTYQII